MTDPVNEAEIAEIIAGYFKYSLRVDLDEDIPACAADIFAAIKDPRLLIRDNQWQPEVTS